MRRIWIWLFWAAILGAQVVPDHYIVELAGEPAGKERRLQIQAGQQRVRAALAQLNAEVLAETSTVANTLAVRIPDRRASELSRVPGVLRVHPVYEVKLHLDRALPLGGVPDAWRQIGGMDKAGLGVKIGIVDTGIDTGHPAFQDSALVVPQGFPKFGQEADQEQANNKIIVARTYENMLGRTTGATPRDEMGHGTAVAMAAAGGTNEGPLGPITGVAPKAYLGNYKVFTGDRGSSRTDVVLKAIDDAVADGMDVINLSLGSALAPRPADSISAQAVERAFAAGVLVVTSAGNSGPEPNTMNSYATAQSAIAVGASWSDRTFGTPVQVADGPAHVGYPGNGPNPAEPVTAPLRDVADLDQDGLACRAFPRDSLQGRIALILRGECFFEDKLNNAERAGAVAAIVFTHDGPIVPMGVGSATLPATMISNADGLDLKKRLAENPDLKATVYFKLGPVPVNAGRVASFSSRGPNADDGVKPDLVAVGTYFYTATQKWNSSGELYHATGYTIEDGTSFSAPLVSGAAAVLKAARPGLTPQQYRSLLISTASPFPPEAEQVLPVQRVGAGRLNLAAALEGAVGASPTAISFGAAGGTLDASREITITNLGAAADTFSIAVAQIGGGPAATTSLNTVQLAPGASQRVTVRLGGSGLEAGEYQGFLRVRGTGASPEARIPYWYAVRSGVPAYLAVLQKRESAAPDSLLRGAIYVRVTDGSGVTVRDVQPTATVAAGGGEVTGIVSVDDEIPGVWAVSVRLGPAAGRNEFEIQAGEIKKTVVVQGTTSSQP